MAPAIGAGGTWTVDRDYIYRGEALLAAETPQGIRHFHLDHLGTPRLITDGNRRGVAYHLYYPFGEEATGGGAGQREEEVHGARAGPGERGEHGG